MYAPPPAGYPQVSPPASMQYIGDPGASAVVSTANIGLFIQSNLYMRPPIRRDHLFRGITSPEGSQIIIIIIFNISIALFTIKDQKRFT